MSGAARENVEDQLRAVQNLAIERAFQIPKLRGSELGVEQNHVGVVEIHQAAQLFQFSRPDERGRIGRLPGLNDGFFHVRAGGVGQGLELVEGFFDVVCVRVCATSLVRAPVRAGLQVEPD